VNRREIWQYFWVIFVLLGCGALYERGLFKIYQQSCNLQEIVSTLEIELEEAQFQNNNLNDRLNSQSDPVWVELTLMKVLGLVPEKHVKVIFKKNKIN